MNTIISTWNSFSRKTKTVILIAAAAFAPFSVLGVASDVLGFIFGRVQNWGIIFLVLLVIGARKAISLASDAAGMSLRDLLLGEDEDEDEFEVAEDWYR